MALLRRFLNQSHRIYVKPSYAPLKPLAALLHTHGSTAPQGFTPFLPFLFNSQPKILLDLAKKWGHLNPTSHHQAEEMLLKVLEQCNAQNLVVEECGNRKKILEGSESKDLDKPKRGVEIWADSVKKKRRKKMNKHKYKKLQKRLRRKTK